MKKITIILLAILSMSCQSQTKNKEVMKKVDQETLLKYFEKIETKARMAYKKSKNIELKLEGKTIAYSLDDNTIRINNHYPHPSKEFNENIKIHQYVVKDDYGKISFWRGDRQVLETEYAYSKIVTDFIVTAERLTSQQGAYKPTMRLMKGNTLVFPDGLKIELTSFNHKRTFDKDESCKFAILEISKNNDEKHIVKIREDIFKDELGRLMTTYGAAKWGKYKIKLTGLSYDDYIDIIVSKDGRIEVDNIKKLGKDSIIQLTMDITSSRFEKSNFERITISANHEDVYVSFINPVKYIPLNKKIITDFTVSILGKTTSLNFVANPNGFRSKGGREYYNPNASENKKVIQFVFDAINKSKEIRNTSPEALEGTMTIKEKNTYYKVLVVSDAQESNYKVKKETGKIYDVSHAHLSKMPMPLEEGEEEMVNLTYYFMNQINTKAGINSKKIKKSFEKLKETILKNTKPTKGEFGSVSIYVSNCQVSQGCCLFLTTCLGFKDRILVLNSFGFCLNIFSSNSNHFSTALKGVLTFNSRLRLPCLL